MGLLVPWCWEMWDRQVWDCLGSRRCGIRLNSRRQKTTRIGSDYLVYSAHVHKVVIRLNYIPYTHHWVLAKMAIDQVSVVFEEKKREGTGCLPGWKSIWGVYWKREEKVLGAF